MTSQAIGASSRHIRGIDGLRAVSVLFVMLLHASYGRLVGGFLGVDIFFVISGFLITHLLMEEQAATGRISLGDFYLRRLFRIVPPLLCTIVLAMLLWRGDDAARWPVVRSVLLFYANFMPAEQLGDLGHTWSLAIEEQFYLVWPFLFLMMWARARRPLILLAALVIIGAIITRFALVRLWADDLTPLYTFTPARLDGIMLGSMLAMLRPAIVQRVSGSARGLQFAAWGAAIGIIACFFFATRDAMQSIPLAFFGFAALAAILVCSVTMLPAGDWLLKALETPVSRYIGKRSYGLYLYHYPLFGALEAFRVEGNLLNYFWVLAAKITLSFAVAELSWRLIERPALGFKAQFAWARKSSATASQAGAGNA